MKSKSAIYKNSIGHLATSMAYGVVAAGCTNRTFNAEDLVIVLEDNPSDSDTYFAGLAIAKGETVTDKGYNFYWPNWQANNPNKVVINKVKFISNIVIIPKSVVGRVTQTDIALANRSEVIDYIMNA